MAKKKSEFVCNACGHTEPKWVGRCPDCKAWNTFEEKEIINEVSTLNKAKNISSDTSAKPINKITPTTYDRISTKISELDRVLGGGMVRDGITILTAEPGTGKSTILMQVCGNIANSDTKVLYVSGEENEGQIKSRADRLGVKDDGDNLHIYTETNIEKVFGEIDRIKPSVLIIDSINTMYSSLHPDNPAGQTVQMKACTSLIIKKAKSEEISVFLIGQQTKLNELAGSREIEHAVDCVIYFEGDKHSSLLVMRPTKNRYGNTDEIGLFEMRDVGVASIENPSEIFITERDHAIPGVALTVSLEGNRPLVVEIESLLRTTFYPNPSIVSEQIKKEKINTLLAIAGIRGGVKVEGKDIFMQVTGGLKISEPSTNLGILMSMISAVKDQEISSDVVFMGEVSLAGDIKKVNGLERRLKEVDKLGFKIAYIPKNNYKNTIKFQSLKVIEVVNVKQLIQLVFG